MVSRFADLAIDSDLPFPDLPPASGDPDIVIRRGVMRASAWTDVYEWRDPDERGVWLTIRRNESEYLLEFPELACTVAVDGRRIEYARPDGLPESTLQHLVLHQVLPLAVSRLGRLVLHASAVETPAGVVGLLGTGGGGKSTLAGAMCARGCALVADDALVVDVSEAGADVWPTADALRLWDYSLELIPSVVAEPDARAGHKHRVRAPIATGRVRLARIVLVGETSPSGVTLEPVARGALRIELLSHLFRLDVTDHDESRRLFELADRLARVVPGRRLIFPNGADMLTRAAAAVMADVGQP